MNNQSLERYSRQILLPQIEVVGQEKLLASQILIIGMGGLGAPAALYLASSGIGHIVICDDDTVELNNLQRQIIHSTEQLGRSKVESARTMLSALNPDIKISTIHQRLEADALHQQIHTADVVIDASDNFKTRFELNRVCSTEKTPLVFGSIIRLQGQATVFRHDRKDSPCYHCLYNETENHAAQAGCDEAGILAPVAGIIGSILATETLKLLLNLGDSLCGRLLMLDAMGMTWRSLKLAKDPNCHVCHQKEQLINHDQCA